MKIDQAKCCFWPLGYWKSLFTNPVQYERQYRWRDFFLLGSRFHDKSFINIKWYWSVGCPDFSKESILIKSLSWNKGLIESDTKSNFSSARAFCCGPVWLVARQVISMCLGCSMWDDLQLIMEFTDIIPHAGASVSVQLSGHQSSLVTSLASGWSHMDFIPNADANSGYSETSCSFSMEDSSMTRLINWIAVCRSSRSSKSSPK